MPYSDILKRAFEIVRREPALWVMGFILALFGGGSSGSNFNWNSGSGGSGSGGSSPFPDNAPTPDLPAWFTPENMIAIVLAVVALFLVLAFIGLIGQSVALTGLIHGTERAARGIDVRWGELLRAGWSEKGRRVLGMRLLLALPGLFAFLLFLALLLSALLPLLSSAMAGEQLDRDPSTLVAGFLGIALMAVCLALVTVLISWILGMIGNYAARAIVLENRPTMAALSNGWQLLRGHIADTVVFSLILGVISTVVGFLFGLLFLFLAFLIALPIFLLLSSMEFPLLLSVVVGLGALLLFIIMGSMLSGPLLAYQETTWTLVWQHLNPASTETPIPLSPEPTLI